MAKSSRLEETLKKLQRLREDPTSEASLRELRKVLGSKTSFAVARAAQIAGEFEISELEPDLVAAFDRFLIDPGKTDKTCAAKKEIVEALYGSGCRTVDIFLKGIRYVQLEPVWGGKEDTAARLRGISALGLVRVGYPDVMIELADLLADRQSPARVAAVQALAYSGDELAVPLLRFKARTGDEDPSVTGECFNALLKLLPEQTSLQFVAEFLDAPDLAVRELAALALGGSRLAAAFDLLRDWWDRLDDAELRRTALLAIATIRDEASLDFLLSLVEGAPGSIAREAVAALRIYRDDDAMVERIEKAAGGRDDVDVTAGLA